LSLGRAPEFSKEPKQIKEVAMEITDYNQWDFQTENDRFRSEHRFGFRDKRSQSFDRDDREPEARAVVRVIFGRILLDNPEIDVQELLEIGKRGVQHEADAEFGDSEF
jgi:hypothetical protein